MKYLQETVLDIPPQFEYTFKAKRPPADRGLIFGKEAKESKNDGLDAHHRHEAMWLRMAAAADTQPSVDERPAIPHNAHEKIPHHY
jgi:hypothetical protein